MTRPLPLVIDTDPGVDDAITILAAIADPAVELKGLTTIFGNVSVGLATRNALALVELAVAEIPVAEGAAVPLVQPPPPHADVVHGADGLGGAAIPAPTTTADPRHAADFLAEMAAAEATNGGLTILAVGPLTNLALALERTPEIAKQVTRVVVMGGSVRHRGNVTPHAEANFWQDPHAAARVLAAPWPVTLVGLDVTETVRLYPDDLAPLTAAAPVAGPLIADMVAGYAAFHQREDGFEGCFLHDPTALLATLEPGLFDARPLRLRVTCEGERIGAVREAADGLGPVEVVLAADAVGIRRRLIGVLSAGRLP